MCPHISTAIMVRPDQAFTLNDTNSVPILGMLANATIDLGTKAFKVWMWGPMWTGILELVAGFWDGINNMWISFLARVSQWVIDLAFMYFLTAMIALIVWLAYIFTQCLINTVKWQLRLMQWTKKTCLEIRDYISTPSTHPVLLIEGGSLDGLTPKVGPAPEPSAEELVVASVTTRSRKSRKSESGPTIKRTRRSPALI